MGQALLPWSLLALVLAWATACDLRTRRIPNALVLFGLLAAAVLHLASMALPGIAGAGANWWSPLAGAFVGASLLMPLHLMGGMGAGDVKLMAVVGAFLGPQAAVWVVLFGLAFGGVVCAVVMLRKRHLRCAAKKVGGTHLPYAPALTCGAALWMWRTW